MKKIEVNNIVDPNTRQPFTSASVSHQLEGVVETVNGIARAVIDNQTILTILDGSFSVSGTAPNLTYSLQAGFSYFEGEVYEHIVTVAGGDGSNTVFFEIDTTYRAGDPRIFSDGQSFNIHAIHKLKLVVVANPGTSDFPAADALKIQDNTKFVSRNLDVFATPVEKYKMRTLEIGVWDMDVTAQAAVDVSFLSDLTKIRQINVMIQDDAQTSTYDINRVNTAGTIGGGILVVTALSDEVILERTTGGFFDGVLFDNGVINRGWVTITYAL